VHLTRDDSGVEAHQCREEAPVGLGQRVPDQVAPAREALLERVEPREHLFHGLVVGGLSRREAGPYTPLLRCS